MSTNFQIGKVVQPIIFAQIFMNKKTKHCIMNYMFVCLRKSYDEIIYLTMVWYTKYYFTLKTENAIFK